MKQIKIQIGVDILNRGPRTVDHPTPEEKVWDAVFNSTSFIIDWKTKINFHDFTRRAR